MSDRAMGCGRVGCPCCEDRHMLEQRLRAEIERLHADIAQHIQEKIALATDNERLRERLKGGDMLAHVRGEQIERLLAAWRWANPHLESLRDLGPEFVAALEHHRRALEGK